MNLLTVFRESKSLISTESELWINYSAGVNFRFNLKRAATPRLQNGIVPRLVIFLFWLIRRVSYRKAVCASPCGVFVFAETLNQWTVTEPCLLGFDGVGQAYEVYVDRGIGEALDEKWRCRANTCNFGVRVLCVAAAVLLARIASLIGMLKQADPQLIGRRLNGFLACYFWMPFFLCELKRASPQIVLCSNDHNAACRSLILAARYLKIKTAYIQHAAVSNRFHRLEFDFSFLDGYYSRDVYAECEKNCRNDTTKPDYSRWVFLSGVKRSTLTTSTCSNKKGVIGVAFKEADGVSEVIDICAALSLMGSKIVIRYHPATSEPVKIKLMRYAESSEGSVSINSPFECDVSGFLGMVGSLVASNSTILLEAALADVTSIYFEFRPPVTPDYYKLVAQGVARHAITVKQIIDCHRNPWSSLTQAQALKVYSHTYGTKWQWKEGLLVASIIKDLLAERNPSELWGAISFDPI